jgi:hypothetical protein
MYNTITGHKAAADAQAKQQAAAAEVVMSLLSENEIQKQQLKHYAQVKQFIDHAVRAYKGNYNMFLLAWDIANRDRYSIQDSLYRGKITLDDVLTVLAEAKQFIDNLEIYLDFSL